MWYIMAKEQRAYDLSERLIRAITRWNYSLEEGEQDVEELIREGAEVNRLHGTLLPLHCASMTGDLSLVQILLEHGAQINQIDGYGRGAVHYAAERNEQCLELILANGADPNTPDSNHDTPLHWACFKNNHKCVRTLLKNGADVDSLDYNHDAPICWAAMKGNLESIKILLEYNAQVDVTNDEGKTPISRLCSLISSGLNTSRDDVSLELLLKASGQFDIRNEGGEMPSFISSDNKLTDMITPYCNTPRNLQELCRFRIRNQLGSRYLPNVACQLPIPTRIQDYVLLYS